MQGWSATARHGVTRKRDKKKNKVYSISLCSWIPDSGCERKETIEIDILVTIYQNNEWTSLKNNKVQPIEPVQVNIYQSYTYRKNGATSLERDSIEQIKAPVFLEVVFATEII